VLTEDVGDVLFEVGLEERQAALVTPDGVAGELPGVGPNRLLGPSLTD